MNVLFFLKPKQEVCVLHKGYTLRQGIEKMRQYGFAAVPVIDEEGRYCGIVTEGDLLRQVLAHEDKAEWEQIPLREAMRTDVKKPVNVMADMDELLQLAMSQNFVPVVDDRGMFIGIVTRQDIIRYFAREYGNREKRRRRYDGTAGFAFPWYQDVELVFLVDGVRKAYGREYMYDMYTYLDAHGELYFIEALENGAWTPIGDVAFSRADMPIVIGEPAYRGRGVGRKVVRALMDRGRVLGYETLGVREIYDFNAASIRCFMACGFAPVEKTEQGWRYEAKL